ncbi:MAG: hypothetical protein KDK97_20700 [Verrucomicrobiales bacterium]|nr:hypothetical protein [Verrucomicrobiales bacterium]MCP5557896.1 hypothetical protein [Verrucomicrobiaceae bacterium]
MTDHTPFLPPNSGEIAIMLSGDHEAHFNFRDYQNRSVIALASGETYAGVKIGEVSRSSIVLRRAQIFPGHTNDVFAIQPRGEMWIKTNDHESLWFLNTDYDCFARCAVAWMDFVNGPDKEAVHRMRDVKTLFEKLLRADHGVFHFPRGSSFWGDALYQLFGELVDAGDDDDVVLVQGWVGDHEPDNQPPIFRGVCLPPPSSSRLGERHALPKGVHVYKTGTVPHSSYTAVKTEFDFEPGFPRLERWVYGGRLTGKLQRIGTWNYCNTTHKTRTQRPVFGEEITDTLWMEWEDEDDFVFVNSGSDCLRRTIAAWDAMILTLEQDPYRADHQASLFVKTVTEFDSFVGLSRTFWSIQLQSLKRYFRARL